VTRFLGVANKTEVSRPPVEFKGELGMLWRPLVLLLCSLMPTAFAATEELPSYLVWPPYLKHKNIPAAGVFHGIRGESRFETNAYGIRGPDFAAERGKEYRILFLGGSATESFYLDQDEAWPALIAKSLTVTADGRGIWIGNIGRSGHNIRDHLMEMRMLVPKLPVDVLVFMTGVNDLGLRLAQDRAHNPHFLDNKDNIAYQLKHAFSVLPDDPDLPFYRKGFLGRLLNPDTQRAKPHHVVDNAGWAFDRWRQLRRQGQLVKNLPSLDAALKEYARNIADIAELAKQMRVRIIFMTQPALWRAGLSEVEQNTLWMGGIGDYQAEGGRYYSAEALAQGLAVYNRTLLDACKRAGAECFDIAPQIKQDLSVFYDDCHFNENGAREVARATIDYLRSRSPFIPTNRAARAR
jgi:lysophospholipase L1-like esterase